MVHLRRNSYVTSRYVTRRQTGLFMYADVFSAAHVETERKEEGGQKEAFRETGRAGRPSSHTGFSGISRRNCELRQIRTCTIIVVPDFSRSFELSGSCTERAISRRFDEGQVSTNTKQSRSRFYELYVSRDRTW